MAKAETRLRAALLAAFMLLPLLADAEDLTQTHRPSPAQSDVPQTLTGNERLGRKWTDGQRINNCGVPEYRRGPKPRPDSCDHRKAGLTPQ